MQIHYKVKRAVNFILGMLALFFLWVFLMVSKDIDDVVISIGLVSLSYIILCSFVWLVYRILEDKNKLD